MCAKQDRKSNIIEKIKCDLITLRFEVNEMKKELKKIKNEIVSENKNPWYILMDLEK